MVKSPLNCSIFVKSSFTNGARPVLTVSAVGK